VLAAKNNQCTGKNIKHTKSEQKASVRKSREKAWKKITAKINGYNKIADA